jgi:hypothetical protein
MVMNASKTFSAAASKSPFSNFAHPVSKAVDRKEFAWENPLGQLGNNQDVFRMFKDGLNLFARHPLKPFEEIIHYRAAFKVLE